MQKDLAPSKLNSSKNTCLMGPDSRKKKPVTTRALEPEMKRFLWDRLQEARNGALRNIGLSGDLPQTEAPALQFVNFLDICPAT